MYILYKDTYRIYSKIHIFFKFLSIYEQYFLIAEFQFHFHELHFQ